MINFEQRPDSRIENSCDEDGQECNNIHGMFCENVHLRQGGVFQERNVRIPECVIDPPNCPLQWMLLLVSKVCRPQSSIRAVLRIANHLRNRFLQLHPIDIFEVDTLRRSKIHGQVDVLKRIKV